MGIPNDEALDIMGYYLKNSGKRANITMERSTIL